MRLCWGVFYSYGPPEAPRPVPRERPEAVSTSSTVFLHGTPLQTLYVKARSCTHNTWIQHVFITQTAHKIKAVFLRGVSKIKTWLRIILALNNNFFFFSPFVKRQLKTELFVCFRFSKMNNLQWRFNEGVNWYDFGRYNNQASVCWCYVAELSIKIYFELLILLNIHFFK